ncbi:MAG: CoA transferase [Deltaproteobacteria bacterium]|nr:MAG: CoA transferase [Deltaproteobacteria bacterium]
MDKALEGIRVADFSIAWAGPHATELLAFLGAEVIKIESRMRVDHSRTTSITTSQVFREMDVAPTFSDINLGKLSVRLNLKKREGVELAKEIVRISDIAIQNLRPGVLDRLGLGYEALKEVNPDIIYLSSSALGATGPESRYIGYAPSFAAVSGLSWVTGYPDCPPVQLFGEIDFISATTSAFVTLAALHFRERTGQGQHIDLSSAESISCLIGEMLIDYTMNDRNRACSGNRDEMMAPHGCYRCKGEDKWVSIAAANDEEWKAFCRAVGDPEWTRDERFSDQNRRRENQDELDRLIGEWTAKHTDYEVMHILQKAGVAAVPSFSNEELFNDEHLKERGLFTEIDHPKIGKRTVVGAPWKLKATPPQVRRDPLFGEHNDYVFGELLGLPAERIRKLMDEEVIY